MSVPLSHQAEGLTWTSCLRSNIVTLLNVVSMAVGIAVGYSLKEDEPKPGMALTYKWVYCTV